MNNTSSSVLRITSHALRTSKIAALAALAACAAAPSAHAAAATWSSTAAGSYSWSTSTNWNPAATPGVTGVTSLATATSTDTVTFGTNAGLATVTVGTGQNVAQMNITGGTYTFTGGSFFIPTIAISGGTNNFATNPLTGSDLTVTGGTTTFSSSPVNLIGTTSVTTGTLTVTGSNQTYTTGAVNLTSGTFTTGTSAALNTNNLIVTGTQAFVNNGTALNTGALTLSTNTINFNGGANNIYGTVTMTPVAGALSITQTNGAGSVFYSTATTLSANSLTMTNNSTSGMSYSGAFKGGASGTSVLTLNGSYVNYAPTGFSSVFTGYQNNAGNISWFNNFIGDGAGGSLSLVKNGTGYWAVHGSNTFSGTVTIDGSGLLDVNNLGTEGAAGGVASNFGKSSNAASNIFINGGGILFTSSNNNSGGATAGVQLVTDRLFTIGDATGSGNSATIDSSAALGSAYNATGTAGAMVNFTNAGQIAFYSGTTAAHSLILQGNNLSNNTFNPQITDQAPGAATSLTKNGIGTWILTNSNNYTGATTLNGGTLRDVGGNGVSAGSSLVINDGVYETNTNVNRTIGTGAGTFVITGGQSGFSANGANVSDTLNGGNLQMGTTNFNPVTFVLNGWAANANLTLNDNIDLNGGNRTIANFATGTTATINGTITNSVANTPAGLGKAGNGALVLTQSNSYDGGTSVSGGILDAQVAGSLGKGNATVTGNSELRLDNANSLASGKTVTLSAGGIVGESYNATQAQLASTIASGSNGALAIDGTQSNGINMSALGNGQMFLGSVKGGSISGPITVTGGTIQGSPIVTGGTYQLGAGGGTLTITGSNVLTDQTPQLILSNATNQLQTGILSTPANATTLASTSNTRNSVTIGNGQAGSPLYGGTVDLQASQNYTGYTKINNGGTLVLDYSTSGTGVVGNMISSASPVILNGGTLNMAGGANQTDTQTLGGVNLSYGGSTITTSSGAGGTSTLNLGNLTFGNTAVGAVAQNLTKTGATLLINGGAGTTVTLTNTNAGLYGPETTGSKTIGNGAVVYNSGGTYYWAAANTSGSAPYAITNYNSETAYTNGIVTNSTTDYLMTTAGTYTAAATQSLNLLRVNNTNTATAVTLNTGANRVNLNGILDTGNGNFTLNGGNTAAGGIQSLSGTIYLDNYGTGTLTVNSAIEGTTDVVYGGTGIIARSGGGFALADSYTGNTYLDGATLQMPQNTNPLGTATGTFYINSGTLVAAGNTSGISITQKSQWNGNFSVGKANNSYTNTTGYTWTGGVTLTNNITVTVNTGGLGNWAIGSTLSDAGYGYNLIIGSNSLQFKDNGSITNSQFSITGTNTTIGNFVILGDGIGFSAPSTNRNNAIVMAAQTIATFGNNNIAGLQDAGAANNTESVSGTSLTLWGSGNYSFGGNISGTTPITMNNAGGTQTLTGSNSFTGQITSNAGTLIIDASQGGSLSGTSANALAFTGSGTVEVKGSANGTTARFGNITNTGGGNGTLIVDGNGGSTTLTVGTIGTSAVGSTLDLVAKGSTTPIFITATTTNNSVGTLGGNAGHVVYTDNSNKTTWATVSTAGVISAYTGDTTTLTTTSGISTVNYQLTGSQVQGGGNTISMLRIANTSAGSLDLNGKSLLIHNTGLLFNGSSSYTIQDSVGTGSLSGSDISTDQELIIQNYATGANTALTIGAAIVNSVAGRVDALTVSGPGETILTGSNTYGGGTFLNGPGIVNFNSNAAFGSAGAAMTFNGGTIQYATGTTVDFTASGVGNSRAMTFNAAGGTIDTNGNKEVYTGTTFGTGIGGLTVSDAAGTGSLQINGTTGYTGNTTIKNGGDLILGSTGVLGGSQNAGTALTIVGSGGTLQGGANPGANTSKAGVVILQSGGVLAPGAGIGTQVIQGTGLSTSNTGSVNTTTVQLNVLSATSLTFNAGGTIKFELDSTDPALNPGAGTAYNPSASTQINLGQGALVKGTAGVGQFVLDFGNTGNYDPSNQMPNASPSGYQNVYDLINFGGTSLVGGPDGNTNFNIDDFTIKNLSGIGTLSFWYNNSTQQEELLLTVVPEPSTWAMLIGGLATLIFWTRKRAARRSVIVRNK